MHGFRCETYKCIVDTHSVAPAAGRDCQLAGPIPLLQHRDRLFDRYLRRIDETDRVLVERAWPSRQQWLHRVVGKFEYYQLLTSNRIHNSEFTKSMDREEEHSTDDNKICSPCQQAIQIHIEIIQWNQS